MLSLLTIKLPYIAIENVGSDCEKNAVYDVGVILSIDWLDVKDRNYR